MSIDKIISYTKEFSNKFKQGLEKTRKLTREEKAKFSKIFKDQVIYEDKFTTNSRICHPDGKGSLMGISVTELSGAHSKAIVDNLKYKFYDSNMMEEVRCVINTIIDIQNNDGISERARIHHFLDGLQRFGAPSAYNFALRGDIKAKADDNSNDKGYHQFTSDMIVIKCPREPINAKELIHELVCGVGALNNLRKYIPNFSYVYDAFYCGAPVVNDKSKEVVNWCMNVDNPVSYVIYENVTNPIAFGDIAKDKKSGVAKEFLMYMGQIALAEYLAELLYNFAHCDLHGDNVLLREFTDELFYIPYSFNNEVYYVPSPGKIATFIDYGMSHIQLPDKTNVGKLDASGFFANVGISPFDTTAIADIHKLLCFVVREALIKQNEELLICSASLLFGYFYDTELVIDDKTIDNIMIIIEGQFEGRYHVDPDTVREKGWNMTSFIEYLNKFSQQLYQLTLLNEKIPEGSKVLGDFFVERPPSKEEIKDELNIKIPEIPSLFDLSQNPNNKSIKEAILKNIKVVVHEERNAIQSILNDTNHSFFVIPVDADKFEKQINDYVESIDNTADVLNGCYKLKEKLKEIKFAQQFLKSKSLDSLIDEAQRKLDEDVNYIKRIKSSIVENYKKLQYFIFGKQKSEKLTEQEIDTYGTHKFFNIYDKYTKVIDTLSKL